MSSSFSSLLLLFFLSFPVTASVQTEKRCGWLHNPTPANHWLVDADGLWIISAQGGYQAKGIDLLPEIDPKEYVATNRSYGYFCACLDVVTDRKHKRVIRIFGGMQQRLAICRNDPALKGTYK